MTLFYIQSHYLDSKLTSQCLILVILIASLDDDKYQFWKSLVWLAWESKYRPTTQEASALLIWPLCVVPDNVVVVVTMHTYCTIITWCCSTHTMLLNYTMTLRQPVLALWLSVRIMWLSGISGHGAEGLVAQWGSTIKSPLERTVTSQYQSWYDLKCC